MNKVGAFLQLKVGFFFFDASHEYISYDVFVPLAERRQRPFVNGSIFVEPSPAFRMRKYALS